jgi:hypothetical protein
MCRGRLSQKSKIGSVEVLVGQSRTAEAIDGFLEVKEERKLVHASSAVQSSVLRSVYGSVVEGIFLFLKSSRCIPSHVSMT